MDTPPSRRLRRRADLATPPGPGLQASEAGFIVGLLVGEGHFGGDGRQAHVTLRMHTRHAATFERLVSMLPGSRLYGPYHHGGRSYFQWMCRGRYLTDVLVPLILQHRRLLDDYVWQRFETMCFRYGIAHAQPPAS